VRAGWRCAACDALLCPGCTYVARAGTFELPSCVRCRAAVEPLRVRRSEQEPYLHHLGRALRYPLRPGSVIAILGCALVMVVLGFLPLGGFFAFGIQWSFLFAVIRQSSRGSTEFEPPEASDPWEAILMPAVRGLIALAILWVPALLRAGAVLAGGGVGSAVELATDPVLWLLLLAGVLYAPSAILHAAFGSSFGMLNPVRVVGTAVRLGGDYLLAVGAVLLVFLSAYLFDFLFPAAFGAIPFVSALLRETAGLVAPTFAAHLLGLLLYVRGDDAGLGPEEEYLVPVLGDAQPRGAEPPALQAPEPVRPPPEPIELEVEPGPSARPAAAALVHPPAPTPAPSAVAAPARFDVDPGAELARLVAARDLAGAARLFEVHRRAPLALSPALLFEIGRGASQAGAHAVAAEALHRAAGGDDPAVAPQALLVLGRILERRLGRPADARKVWLHLVRHHADTDAARQAQAALEAMGPPSP